MLRDIYKLEKAKRVSVKATSVSKICTYEYGNRIESIFVLKQEETFEKILSVVPDRTSRHLKNLNTR